MKRVIILLVWLFLGFNGSRAQKLAVLPAGTGNNFDYLGHANITMAAFESVSLYFDRSIFLLVDTTDFQAIDNYKPPYKLANINYWGRKGALGAIDNSSNFWFVGSPNDTSVDLDSHSKIQWMRKNLVICGAVDSLGNRRSAKGSALEFVESFYFLGRDESKSSYAAGIIFGKFLNYCVEMGYDPAKINLEIFNLIRREMRISTNKKRDKYRGYGTPAIRFDINYNPITPVELVNFAAAHTGDNTDALLTWSTYSETNNWGFYVEVSVDSLTAFQKIGFLKGQGTTNEVHYYQFVDEKVDPAGIYYYRLRQVDTDGWFSFSEIKVLRPKVSTNVKKIQENKGLYFSLQQNYPNPFNSSTTIEFQIEENISVMLSVYDLLGREVAMIINEPMKMGAQKIVFDASGLGAGVYFYRLRAGSFSEIKKMILIK